MPRFVALFRGINVGRAERVAMAELRALLTALGYADVVTVLNSGNAVFAARAGAAGRHAQAIQQTLAGRLGVQARVVVVPAAQFAAAVAANPLLGRANNPSRLLLAFTQQPATLAELAELASADWGADALAVGRHAAYLWCAGGVRASRLAQAVDRRLGERVTTRNGATVDRIAALLQPRLGRTAARGPSPAGR